MSLNFINAHKVSSKDFSRKRKLPLIDVLILIFRKSVKSLQVMLKEKKLKHAGFFLSLHKGGLIIQIGAISSFDEINAMFKPERPSDAIVVSTAPVKKVARQLGKLGLPEIK